MIWEPFLLALVLGLVVSAGLYYAYLWPSVEPLEEATTPTTAATASTATPSTPASSAPDASPAPAPEQPAAT